MKRDLYSFLKVLVPPSDHPPEAEDYAVSGAKINFLETSDLKNKNPDAEVGDTPPERTDFI